VLVRLKLDKEGTETMTTVVSRALFSWKSSAVGLASIALGVIKASTTDHSLIQIIEDPTAQIMFVVGVLGLIAKDSDAHGTPSAPITAATAEKTAIIADSTTVAVVPPLPAPPIPATLPSFVGDPIGASTVCYSIKPNDTTPVGFGMPDPRGKFVKRSATVCEKIG
jgi:hypothetical protein